MTDLTPIWLSLHLAFVTTLLLFVVAMPIAYQLAYKKFWLKPVVETLVSMPLVLPPTVLGFYLLLAFSPEAGIGRFFARYAGAQAGIFIRRPGICIHHLQFALYGTPAAKWISGDTS
jgi:molybdate transport system permease protein